MISLIIPAYNEAGLIGLTVSALHDAARAAATDGAAGTGEEGLGTGGGYEIIVVDDASTDGTAGEAATAGARVVRVDKRQISAVRNAGAREACGDVLIFVDADTLVPAAAVAAAAAALRSGAAGGGAGVDFDGWVPRYARVMLALMLWLFRVFKYTGGCFLFCTRAAYDATEGWSEDVYAVEEILMARALKRQGRFVIIKPRVVTSGRKLRTHSAREILWTMTRLSLRGLVAVRSRKGLEIWYEERREDVQAGAQRG